MLEIADGSLHELGAKIIKRLPNDVNISLLAPITVQEIQQAVMQGGEKKSPGIDGIPLEFYTTYWAIIKSDPVEIYNRILQTKCIPEQFLEGVICCVPKRTTKAMMLTTDYRPITLLNADYKILARIIAKRLMNYSTIILVHTSQYCGGIERTILDALSGIRDVLGYVESTQQKACLVSLDFSSVFDISHTYLVAVLRSYGLNEESIQLFQALYDAATSRCMVNGTLSHTFPIKRGIRQGCPLSMILFTIAINPLLEMMARDLRMEGGSGKVTHFAYAYDVTIILTNSTEIAKLKEIIRLYETASGATINERKSKALSLNGWNRSHDIFGIPYVERIKILGITFWETIEGSTSDTWSWVTNAVKAMAQEHYYRVMFETSSTICTRISTCKTGTVRKFYLSQPKRYGRIIR
jgi:hypothetical protein